VFDEGRVVSPMYRLFLRSLATLFLLVCFVGCQQDNMLSMEALRTAEGEFVHPDIPWLSDVETVEQILGEPLGDGHTYGPHVVKGCMITTYEPDEHVHILGEHAMVDYDFFDGALQVISYQLKLPEDKDTYINEVLSTLTQEYGEPVEIITSGEVEKLGKVSSTIYRWGDTDQLPYTLLQFTQTNVGSNTSVALSLGYYDWIEPSINQI